MANADRLQWPRVLHQPRGQRDDVGRPARCFAQGMGGEGQQRRKVGNNYSNNNNVKLYAFNTEQLAIMISGGI